MMKLSIVTTQRVMSYEVEWVELNTPVGNMVVQYGHTPMMIELAQGHELRYQLMGGVVQTLKIGQGVACVTRVEVKILLPIDL